MIKLWGFPISNYYNKVKLVLLEKSVSFDEALMRPSQEPKLTQLSPMGKIPCIEWDGHALSESGVIAEYLEDTYPEPPLLPRDPVERARVREILAVLEIHLELHARRLYKEAFFGGSVSEETKLEVAKELAKGVRALRQLAKFTPFIAGSTFSLADCAAVVHLPLVTMASRKIYGKDALEDIAAIKPYLKLCGERPAVKRVNDDRKAAQEAAAKS